MSDQEKTSADTSDAAMEDIRQRLRDYMREQMIGVPALHKRINTALGLDSGGGEEAMALKTLQRFLAGTSPRDHDLRYLKSYVAALDGDSA